MERYNIRCYVSFVSLMMEIASDRFLAAARCHAGASNKRENGKINIIT